MTIKTPFFNMLLCICLGLPGYSFGDITDKDQPRPLRVVNMTVCLNVSDLKCSGINSRFPPDVGKLYCLTRVVGARIVLKSVIGYPSSETTVTMQGI